MHQKTCRLMFHSYVFVSKSPVAVPECGRHYDNQLHQRTANRPSSSLTAAVGSPCSSREDCRRRVAANVQKYRGG